MKAFLSLSRLITIVSALLSTLTVKSQNQCEGLDARIVRLSDQEIVITGQWNNHCNQLKVEWSTPSALPSKTVNRAPGESEFNIHYTVADGLSAIMMRDNFYCESIRYKVVLICGNEHCSISQPVSCTPSNKNCPTTTTIAVTNPPKGNCFPPGTYTVSITSPIPEGMTIFWTANGQVIPGAQGTSVPISMQNSDVSVTVAGFKGNCNIGAATTLTACTCSIPDIDLHCDGKNLVAQASVAGPAGQTISARLTIAGPNGTTESNLQSDNDGNLILSKEIPFAAGDYTVTVNITDPASCVNQQSQSFRISEKCDNESRVFCNVTADCNFCSIGIIALIILFIISFILLIAALCSPNQVTIIAASIAIGLFLIALVAWWIYCGSVLTPDGFCFYLDILFTVLAWISTFAIVLILLLTFLGCPLAVWALGYLGTIMGIVSLIKIFSGC